MILLGTWADSDVYQSNCGNWVYKAYRSLKRDEILAYHSIQWKLSERVKKSPLPWEYGIPLTDNKSPEILNTRECEVFEGSEVFPDNPTFAGRIVSKIPFIKWTNLDAYPGVELYDAFYISNKIRDTLHDTIGFPMFLDLNPMNIRITPKWRVIITDVASEIESLLYL